MQHSIFSLRRIAKTLGGLVIYGCIPGSPAHHAGLRRGDILLRINGHPASDLETYFTSGKELPSATQLTILRDGSELEVTVTHLPTLQPPKQPSWRAQDSLGKGAKQMTNLRAAARAEVQTDWAFN